MFENVGRQIKNIVGVLFILETIATFVGSIVIAYLFNYWTFVIALAGGMIVVYVSCMTIAAIGEFLEDVRRIANNTGKIAGNTEKIGR